MSCNQSGFCAFGNSWWWIIILLLIFGTQQWLRQFLRLRHRLRLLTALHDAKGERRKPLPLRACQGVSSGWQSVKQLRSVRSRPSRCIFESSADMALRLTDR